jgi:uncharacterized membrane protein YkoI
MRRAAGVEDVAAVFDMVNGLGALRSGAIQSPERRTPPMTLRAAILAALIGVTAPAVGHAQDSLGAGWRQQQDEAQRGVRQGRNLPLAQVIQMVQQRAPGRLLDAGLEQGPGGRSVYRVRWATEDGRRIDFIVDAQSGQILSGG